MRYHDTLIICHYESRRGVFSDLIRSLPSSHGAVVQRPEEGVWGMSQAGLPSLLGRVMRARERLPAPGRPVARSRRRRARSTPPPSYIAHRTARAARTTSHASYPASSYFVHLTSYIVAHLKILIRIFTPCLARGASFTQHPLVTL